jgi:hypothetical protein
MGYFIHHHNQNLELIKKITDKETATFWSNPFEQNIYDPPMLT